MDTIPPEICNQIISDKLSAYAYIMNVDSYEVIYMTEQLTSRLKSEGHGFGTRCYEVMHGLTKPCALCPKNTVIEEKTYKWHEYDAELHKHFTNVDYLLNYNEKQYLVHTTMDVTDEVETINVLQKEANNSSTIISCASVLINHYEPSTSIRALLKILIDFYDAEFAYLFERDYMADQSNCTYHHCSDRCSLTKENFELSFSLSEQKDWVSYIKNKEYAFLEAGQDTDSVFPIKNNPIFIGVNENCLVTPLLLNGATVGTICIANIRTNIGDFAPVTKITAFIVNSLTLKYSEQNLQKSVDTLVSRNALNQTLLECAQTLLLGNDTNEALTKLLKIICTYFNASYAYILERDFTDQTTKAAYWYWQDEAPTVRPKATPFVKLEQLFDYYKENDVMVIESLDEMRDRYKETDGYKFLQQRNVTSLALTPLRESDTRLGFLWIENPKSNLTDLSLLATLSVFIVNHITKDLLMKKYKDLSYTDMLTGLYNRNYYMNYLTKIQNNGASSIGTIYADVNALKFANDKLGHEYGDMLLQWCGRLFASLPNVTACRIGGDEFVCFIENISEEDFKTYMNDIYCKLGKISDVHISIGSVWHENVTSGKACVKEADNHMYEVKQQYYSERANSNKSEEEEISALKQAILHLDTIEYC